MDPDPATVDLTRIDPAAAGQGRIDPATGAVMHNYSVKSAADALGIAPRTLRRWITAGEVEGAEQVNTRNGPAWRIPRAALEQLRNRTARDVEAVPVIDLEQDRTDQADKTSSSSTTGAELATAGATATGIPWVDVRAMLEATEQRAAAERDHWQRLADSQTGIIAGLRNDLERERDETLRLRVLLAEQAEQVVALSGQLAKFERFHARSTTPISRAQLRALDGGAQ